MFRDRLQAPSPHDAVSELLERAAAEGRAQGEAFAGMEDEARAAVRAMVNLFLNKGCMADGIGSGPAPNQTSAYWVLRDYGEQTYGGGNLFEIPRGSRTGKYSRIVAVSTGVLTVGESRLRLGAVRLFDPRFSRDTVFNVKRLTDSRWLCKQVGREVIDDIGATTRRVSSRR